MVQKKGLLAKKMSLQEAGLAMSLRGVNHMTSLRGHAMPVAISGDTTLPPTSQDYHGRKYSLAMTAYFLRLPRALRVLAMTIFISVLSLNSAFAIDDKPAQKPVRIAAGSVLEGYYFIGLKLCKYISESNNGIPCDVVPTAGTIENIGLLHNGEVDFAFAQSNLALDAYNGVGYFIESNPFREMVQLLRLHDEAFTVIVKDKDQILNFADLDGKKISNGPRNSDSSVMYLALSAYYDFKKEPLDIELFHEVYAKQFCDGKVDALVLMTGHPNALVNYITHSCESDFLNIEADKIDILVKSNFGFKKYTIDANGYPGINKSVQTVAAPAIFISKSSISKEIITNFQAYFKDRIDNFKDSSPLLYDLSNDHFTSGFILPRF